jgi:hypothetical protein
MDRMRLERYLEEGFSLDEIGILENRDPSTVSYWLRKFDLEPNGRAKHAAKGTVTRETLEPLVKAGLTIAEIGEHIGRSAGATRHWLRKHGLKTSSRRGPKPMVPREAVEAAIAAGLRTVEGDCRHHGPSVFVIEPSGKVRCRKCRMQRVAERRRRNKWVLAEEAGGKCVRCGYDKFIGALQFHHLDRKEKSFGLAQNGSTMGLDALREEAKKCVLLCANCHSEVEHGRGDLPLEF